VTFVLVHGAFGTPTELAPVIPLLEALGHRAIAVDLPCANPAATLDDYAVEVVGAMARIEGPVVVVGHSAGGATISLVPGRSLPDVPRTYVLCTEDKTIPPPKQREMAARLGVDPIEIASDHSVFALQPRELAAVLAAQGRST
jgi:pimeloyl-ACP methyl ester carboxylesterase